MARPKKKKFKATSGARFSNKQAQVIGEELENIKAKEGNLTPDKIVKNSKKKNSPLYNYFEWDNEKAGQQWRMEQARYLVRHIVEVVVVRGVEIQEKAFFSVIGIKEKSNVYVTLSEAISTPSYRRQLLIDMKSKLQSLMHLIDLFNSADK